MAYVGNGTVFTYVPDNCRVDPSSATAEGSADFRIDRWNEYWRSLIPTFSAGIVLGSISAAGFAVSLVWLCVRHRRRRLITRARQAKLEKQQAVKAAATTGKQPVSRAPRMTPGRLLKWLILLLGLAVIGVSAWGLAESIISTDGLVSEFWALMEDIEQLVVDMEASLSSLAVGLDTLSGTLVSAQGLLLKIVDTVGGIPVIGPLIGKVVPLDTIESFLGDQGDAAVSAMNEAVTVLNDTVIPIINNDILPTLDNVKNSQDLTTSLEDTWRYVVFAVLFGLLIIFSAAVAWTCYSMRRGMLATALVCCLWALNAVVCLLGLGLMNGARTIANDTCLYSEELASRLVLEKLEGDAQRIAINALDYYLGRVDLTDSQGNPLLTNGTTECSAELSAALLYQVADIQLQQALIYAWDLAEFLPTVTNLLDSVNLPTIPFVNFDLDSIKDPLVTTSEQLTYVLDQVCNVTLLLLRENNIQPLYFRIKSYVCCDLTDAIYSVWVPWTCAGVLALVLCILATARIVSSTLRPSGTTGRPSDDDPAPDKAEAVGSFIVATNGASPDGKAGLQTAVPQAVVPADPQIAS